MSPTGKIKNFAKMGRGPFSGQSYEACPLSLGTVPQQTKFSLFFLLWDGEKTDNVKGKIILLGYEIHRNGSHHSEDIEVRVSVFGPLREPS